MKIMYRLSKGYIVLFIYFFSVIFLIYTVPSTVCSLQNSISYFNQIIKYQLPHTRFNNISDHKHDIYLYEKLPTL